MMKRMRLTPQMVAPAAARGDWKLIRIFHGGESGAHGHLLFNLRDDPGETKDLAVQQPKRVRELDALIEEFLADAKAAVPMPNPAFNPAQQHLQAEGAVNARQ
jgi:hypothetical protein